MRIEILGTGCVKCRTLEANARSAAEQLGLDYELVKVSSIDEITDRGVMMTPALVVDGVVKLQGRAAPPESIREILTAAVRQPPTSLLKGASGS